MSQSSCCCSGGKQSPESPPENKSCHCSCCETDFCTCSCCSTEPRRGFCVQLTAILVGALLFIPALVSGIIAFLNPLRVKGQTGGAVRITTLDAIPADGTPQKFPVVADRVDAWTRYAAEPIGAVYLRRTAANANTIEALQVVCPHAGCFISLDAAEKQFYCPCHNARFDVSGKRNNTPCDSPRDMDRLEVEIRNNIEVWVKYEKFRTGTPQKIIET